MPPSFGWLYQTIPCFLPAQRVKSKSNHCTYTSVLVVFSCFPSISTSLHALPCIHRLASAEEALGLLLYQELLPSSNWLFLDLSIHCAPCLPESKTLVR